ncbi:uncharacterized protein LOC141630077 [Silene latifolia]|uniref:uncharacterized protein LOC141630077 n=1 Tax=Silene latifolia TaxID=37657 RepID=UPI003D780719
MPHFGMVHKEAATLHAQLHGSHLLQDGPNQVIKANFLVENPVNEDPTINTLSLPDEDILCSDTDAWDLYFDGASKLRGFGVGILRISLEGGHIPISVELDFSVTYAPAEYEACLTGLQAAITLGIKRLRVPGDSSLIINQVFGSWKVLNDSLAPYQEKINQKAELFDRIDYFHLPREENQFADALAKLASLINIPDNVTSMPLCVERRSEPAHICTINNYEENHVEPVRIH